MKKFLSLFLVLSLMVSILTPTTVCAKAVDQNDVNVQTVEIVDVNGNVLGSVPMPRAGIVTGAAICFKGVLTAIYNGMKWVAMHPTETQMIFDMLTTAYNVLIGEFDTPIQTAYHDGNEYTTVITVGGNECYRRPAQTTWNCTYSLRG